MSAPADSGRCGAALYARLSKEDESQGQSQSIQNQLSLLTEFAQSHNFIVFDTYADDGYSGGSFDRPAFSRMIADIEAKRVNVVITKDLSRLGRDYILTGHYLERFFPERGVRYISLLDGIDTGEESSANDITPFRAIMNDMYARDISRKIKSVKREKQRRGLFIGAKPVYGYKKSAQKNKIEIDETAAEVVRGVFLSAAAGASCRSIAQELNARGVPPPAVYAGLAESGRWSGERISEMLQNQTYIGSTVQGRRERASYKSKKCLRRTPENWIIVENTHEPAVERELFVQANEQLESRRKTRARKYDFPLKGLVFCAECGRPMAAVNRKTAGGDRLYFVCRTYQRDTKHGGCTSHCAPERAVARAVEEAVVSLLTCEAVSHALVSAASKAQKEAKRAQNGGVEALKAQLKRIVSQMDEAYGDKLAGTLQPRDFERIYARLAQAREKTEGELSRFASLSAQADENTRAQALARRFTERACENRALLAALVEKIELTKEKRLVVRFNCKQNN